MLGLGKLQTIAIVIGLALLVGIPAVAAYRAGGNSVREAARQEAQKQIDQLTIAHDAAMDAQIALTDHYRELSAQGYEKLLSAIEGIEIKNVEITRNIYQERKADPAYYEQKMPEGGIKQWEAAREQFR